MDFPMRSVTFVQDHCYEGGGVAQEKRSFQRGQTYDLPEPSGAHYVRQGRAVWAEDAEAEKAPPAAPPAPTLAPADKGLKGRRITTKASRKRAPAQGDAPVGRAAGAVITHDAQAAVLAVPPNQ